MKGISAIRVWCLIAILPVLAALPGCGGHLGGTLRVAGDKDVEDIRQIPQKVEALPAVAQGTVGIDKSCQGHLLDDFKHRFFAPWTSRAPLFDPAESKENISKAAHGSWYGVNKRIVPRKQLQELVKNCDLSKFPSLFKTAIAVAPAHLRGLPTPLPLYEKQNDEPFDMLSYPQLKLNEPLRVLHTSHDGVWLFVESASSNGWVERRDVALVDEDLVERWMQAPQLVIIRDYAPVADGRGIGTYPVKIGTILPISAEDGDAWDVEVASAGDGGEAEVTTSRISRKDAAPFPLAFNGEAVSLIGDQMLGHPYGWGEIYDLRDCSGLLRDFFMPFGIWLPRTSSDQIASTSRRVDLSKMTAEEKEEVIKKQGIPFQTLLYKRGHIMLYAGTDRDGRPLVFHDSWSIQLQDGDKPQKKITGISAITTLMPGKELGLVAGSYLVDRITAIGTVTGRCSASAADKSD
jgi:hypothetical protein